MGNPARYSTEVPLRCSALLEDYWAQISDTDYPKFGGPLATTFLVAMAAPMINFPYERIVREDGPQNERHLSFKLADTIDRALRIGRLSAAPFFVGGIWRYYFTPVRPDFSITAVPEDILTALHNPDALIAGDQVHTRTWFSCLRHALAHSAISYVDANGRQDAGSPANSVLFVSERYRNNQLAGYNLFRISRDELRVFLVTWIDWLSS